MIFLEKLLAFFFMTILSWSLFIRYIFIAKHYWPVLMFIYIMCWVILIKLFLLHFVFVIN